MFQEIGQELKDFIKYLSSLCGILTTISAFFPLFNNLKTLIPPPPQFPDTFIVLSAIICIFAIFYTFSIRSQVLYLAKQLRRRAVVFMLIAVVASLSYLFAIPQVSDTIIPKFDIAVDGPIFWPFIFVIPVLYIMIFSFFTLAFSTLAVIEWQRKESIARQKHVCKQG